MRDCRPDKLFSVTLLSAFPGYGMAFIGVGMSPLVARWRKTVSAARKPPGVMLTPLYLIVAGPVSSAFLASACSVATVVLRASLLAFKALTEEFSETASGFTSVVEFTASVALGFASVARPLAAAAASVAF